MSDDNTGQDQTQNDQTGEDNSQNEQQEPFKVFNTKEEYSEAQDKFFRGAYNEGLSKATKDAKQVFGIDGEFESTEDLFKTAKERLVEQQNGSSNESNDNPEVDELRKQLQEYKQEAEQVKQQHQEYKRNQKINGDMDSAINNLKDGNKVTIKDEHLKRLFKDDYNVKLSDDGQTYVERQDGTPVLDGDGNRKSLQDAMAHYVKENSYAQPKAEGVGGGTGGGSGANEKPSFKEFKDLMNSGKQGDREKAAKLREKKQEMGGWAEGDSYSALAQG